MEELGGNVGAPLNLGDDETAVETGNIEGSSESEAESSLRMTLTADERRWVLAINSAIEQEAELDNLSDLMYAQYGIICKDSIADAIDRAQALQWFRHNYGVAGYLEDGEKALREMVQSQPQVYLSFGLDPFSGSYTIVFDLTKVDMRSLTTLGMVNRFYAGNYYLFLSLCPDLESIRRGGVSIAECQGMDWTKKHAFYGLKNISRQLAAFFPYTGKIKHYHT